MPVQLDCGDAGGGDLAIELGEFVEERCVDDADALVEFIVCSSGYSSGDENIAVFLFFLSAAIGYMERIFRALLDVRDNFLTSFSGELRNSLETDGAANGWDVGKGLENLGVRSRLAVVEQDGGC